jgi:hypothetical protein
MAVPSGRLTRAIETLAVYAKGSSAARSAGPSMLPVVVRASDLTIAALSRGHELRAVHRSPCTFCWATPHVLSTQRSETAPHDLCEVSRCTCWGRLRTVVARPNW